MSITPGVPCVKIITVAFECLHLVEGGVCEHVVVKADARGEDGGGRGDGGDGGRRAVRQQDVSLWTVQRNLLCGL